MTTGTITSRKPVYDRTALDATDTVRVDRPCDQCGFDIRGLQLDMRCPECGHPVEHSLRTADLVYAPTSYVRRLRFAFSLLFAAALFLVLACVPLLVAAAAGGFTFHGTGAVLTYMGVFWLLVAGLCLPPGVLLLATPLRRDGAHAHRTDAQCRLRRALVISVLLTLVLGAGASAALTTGHRPLLFGIAAVGGLLGLTMALVLPRLLYQATAALLHRANNPRLAGFAERLVSVHIAITAAAALLAAVAWPLGLAGPFPLGFVLLLVGGLYGLAPLHLFHHARNCIIRPHKSGSQYVRCKTARRREAS